MTIGGRDALETSPAHAKGPQVSGTLVAMNINARRATVRTQKNGNVIVSIPVAAKVERNGVHVGLKAFQAGDQVQAKFDAAGAIVMKFEAVGP